MTENRHHLIQRDTLCEIAENYPQLVADLVSDEHPIVESIAKLLREAGLMPPAVAPARLLFDLVEDIPQARSALAALLRAAYNVVEYERLLRLEEDRSAGSAHVTAARASLRAWSDKLDSTLGDMEAAPEGLVWPKTPRERVREVPADEATAVIIEKAKEKPPEPLSEEENRALAEKEPMPTPIPLGDLEGMLNEDEATLMRRIARITGHVPVVQQQRDGDGVVVSCTVICAVVAQVDNEKKLWSTREFLSPEHIRSSEKLKHTLREALRIVNLEHRKEC